MITVHIYIIHYEHAMCVLAKNLAASEGQLVPKINGV